MEFLIVLGSGVALLGLAFLIWIVVTKHREQGTPNWPSVQGEILESKVVPFERETPEGRERTFTPLIRYRYTVGEQRYTSANLNFLPDTAATYDVKAKAESVAAHYPAGSPVSVFYNPSNPGQAALEIPRPAAHNAVLFFGITNLIVGLAIIALGIVLLRG
ncbi:MAG: DUF3592 domain-containing protein [Anaerolineae bacterium]